MLTENKIRMMLKPKDIYFARVFSTHEIFAIREVLRGMKHTRSMNTFTYCKSGNFKMRGTAYVQDAKRQAYNQKQMPAPFLQTRMLKVDSVQLCIEKLISANEKELPCKSRVVSRKCHTGGMNISTGGLTVVDRVLKLLL